MKKISMLIMLILLSFCLILSLFACAPADGNDDESKGNNIAAGEGTEAASYENKVSEVPEYYQNLTKEIKGYKISVSKVENTYVKEISVEDVASGTVKKYEKTFSGLKSFDDIFEFNGKIVIITGAGKNCGEISLFDIASCKLLNDALITSYVFDENRREVFYVSYEDAGEVFTSSGVLTAKFETLKQVVDLSVNADGSFSGSEYLTDGSSKRIVSSEP